MSQRLRARRTGRALLALATLVAVAGLVVGATPVTAAQGTKTYIVQMIQEPAVAYAGGIAGLPATKPAKGSKIDPDSAAVREYVRYLKGRHDEALAKVGGAQKVYDYAITYNGFAARLTEKQAQLLEKQPDVVAVSEDEMVTVDTSSTPTFLGLDATGGLWEQLGGPDASKLGTGAGEDIVIGVVDSGIWAESKSFTDRDSKGKLAYLPLNTSKWHGKKCADGEAWTTDLCNKKLVGARHFNASWGGDAAVEAERPWEFQSPRDYNGHGTHTAGTAGGNYDVSATGPAAVFGTVSGIAPRARIAAYKALWSTEDGSTASGFTGDLVAAIDQAVADGVDVINYSISGSRTAFTNAVMVSFLFAADAGVFVSASAGNSGPTTATVAHPGPWVTTVAAGTHNRDGRGSVTLGNGVTYTGASVANAVGPAALIDSVDAGLASADPDEVELCYPGTLDPAKVAGKIVLCLRGAIARVDKSLAVEMADGVGMVMYNDPDSSLNADFHFVPTVHVDKASGLAIKAYIAGAGSPTATINEAEIVYDAPAPFTASFSSRGPLQAGGGDILKPDVIAPGQDILAAVAPPGNAGRDFNLYSGTSMSAPHVAGLAALLKQKHPTWSPMAIKSALMTSATDVLDSTGTANRIFRQGGGHVRPNSAANPGLVYDAGFGDWLAFLKGQGLCCASSSIPALDASDLNQASIAIGALAGVQTVTRTVTNVGAAGTYTASVSGLTGITVEVTPSQLTLDPGESGTFTVKFTRTSAALNVYHGGFLTWSHGTHTVRSPIVVRPVALAAPAEVASDGSDVSWDVTPGYDGALSATVAGLVPATETAYTVAQDPDQTFDPSDSTGTFSKAVVVPANSLFRAGVYEDAITPGDTDLDLYVYAGTSLVGFSADGDSNEEVTLRTGASGATFTVYVHGWSTGSAPQATGTLFDWVATADGGNTTVSGVGPASIGVEQTHTASFSGLAAGTRYLGEVRYGDGSATIGRTILSVRTP